ncbi:hypothetical protein NPIL_293541 [Nephila pilipes]|uniref:Uncharacterized protein n=1 Tax=Nephila pilipes TaxID=299642 RepID=A0A8X6TR73_NEPPI|nr:hypothetical protein NPIL_293541 [Nephila pilipes]
MAEIIFNNFNYDELYNMVQLFLTPPLIFKNECMLKKICCCLSICTACQFFRWARSASHTMHEQSSFQLWFCALLLLGIISLAMNFVILADLVFYIGNEEWEEENVENTRSKNKDLATKHVGRAYICMNPAISRNSGISRDDKI